MCKHADERFLQRLSASGLDWLTLGSRTNYQTAWDSIEERRQGLRSSLLRRWSRDLDTLNGLVSRPTVPCGDLTALL